MANMTDYAETRQQFSWDAVFDSFDWDAPEELNMGHEICERWTGADSKALVAERVNGRVEEFTFDELDAISNSLANALNRHGFLKRDHAAILLPMIPEVYHSLLGTLKAGIISLPSTQGLGNDSLSYRINDSGATALITTYGEIDRIRGFLDETALETVFLVDNGEAEEQILSDERFVDFNDEVEDSDSEYKTVKTSGDDVAFLQYTSGTTGQPKGCKAPHRMLAIHKVFGKYGLDLHDDDLYWLTADMGWAAGPNLGMCAPWVNQVPVYQYEGQFDGHGVIEKLANHHITNFYTAPTAYRMMARNEAVVEKFDLGHLRHLSSLGEPLNLETIEWTVDKFGVPIHDTYGQTETGLSISNYPCLDVKAGSMGKPMPGFDVVLLDEDRNKIEEPNTTGEITYPKGLPMFLGYWKRPDLNEELFKDGFFHSGDLAYFDEEGYYWYVSRKDDVIITSGHRVSPFEVEDILFDHEAVKEVGVIGVPDNLRGEIIKAYVSTSEGFSPSKALIEELQEFTKERLAAYEYPREIEFLEGLPKTDSGKISRHVLREKEDK